MFIHICIHLSTYNLPIDLCIYSYFQFPISSSFHVTIHLPPVYSLTHPSICLHTHPSTQPFTQSCTQPTTHPTTLPSPIHPSRDTGKNHHSPPWSPLGCEGRGGSPPLLSGKMEWVRSSHNPASFLGQALTAPSALKDSPSLPGGGGGGSWRLSVTRQVDSEP